jgi:hypothetical protein
LRAHHLILNEERKSHFLQTLLQKFRTLLVSCNEVFKTLKTDKNICISALKQQVKMSLSRIRETAIE